MHVHHIISNWPYNVPYFWENLDATLTPWLLASPWVWCRKPSYSVGRELAGSHRAGAQNGPKMGPKWTFEWHLMGQWWFSDGFGGFSSDKPSWIMKHGPTCFQHGSCFIAMSSSWLFQHTASWHFGWVDSLDSWISWRKDIRFSLVELSFGVKGMAWHGAAERGID